MHLYGCRLGILTKETTAPQTGIAMEELEQSAVIYTFTRGEKIFELFNHLGNVLVTLSHWRLPVLVPEGVELCDDPDYPPCYRPIDSYEADVVTASDYYPGGMDMPGIQFSSTTGYRYGFNGKEKDKETTNNNIRLWI